MHTIWSLVFRPDLLFWPVDATSCTVLAVISSAFTMTYYQSAACFNDVLDPVSDMHCPADSSHGSPMWLQVAESRFRR
jgi:hypothetical protein